MARDDDNEEGVDDDGDPTHVDTERCLAKERKKAFPRRCDGGMAIVRGCEIDGRELIRTRPPPDETTNAARSLPRRGEGRNAAGTLATADVAAATADGIRRPAATHGRAAGVMMFGRADDDDAVDATTSAIVPER